MIIKELIELLQQQQSQGETEAAALIFLKSDVEQDRNTILTADEWHEVCNKIIDMDMTEINSDIDIFIDQVKEGI